LRHTDYQRLHFLVDHGAPWGCALYRAVKLLRDEFAVPGENRVRFDDVSHFLQGLLPQLVADLSERLALAVTEVHASCELVAEHAIFRHEVFIAQQQFLINGPSDLRQ